MHNMQQQDSPASLKRRLMSCDASLPVPVPVSNKRKRNVSFAPTWSAYDSTSSHRDASSCAASWITKDDIMTMVRSHPTTVQQLNASDPRAFNTYCELLATTYTNSVVEGDSAAHTTNSSTPVAALSYTHFLGISNSSSSSMDQLRGLEAFVLSSVASDRMQRRRRYQSTMLRAQVKLSGKTSEMERASLMRQLGERLSASSCAFARNMGAADAISAMMEHAASLQQQQQVMMTTRSTTTIASATTPIMMMTKTTSPLTTSLPVGSTAKRRCVPCKVVSPMA